MATGAGSGPDVFTEPAANVLSTPLSDRLTLADAEELLVQRSAAVAAQRYQLQVSQQLRLIAGYKPNPVLYFAAEQFVLWSPVPGTAPRFFHGNSNASGEPTYTFQYQKVFERGGKRELRVEQADAQVQAARYQILDAFRTQLLSLRQAYANSLLARDNLALAQSIDQQYARTEELTQLRVNQGDLAAVDLYRIQSGRLQYQQAVLDAQTGYQQSVRDLLNVLSARPEDVRPGAPNSPVPPINPAQVRQPGQPVAPGAAANPLTPVGTGGGTVKAAGPVISFSPLTVEGSFLEPEDLPDIAALRQKALDQRPDVQAARSNVAAAEAAVKLAEAQRHRDVAVAFEYQTVGQDQTLGITTQVPLFQYNNQFAGIAQAQAQLRNAQALQRQVEFQAVTDVEKAYLAYQSARRSIALYNQGNLQQVEKLRSITEYSYRSGASTLLDYLDAQRTAAAASVAYNQARSSYQLSFYQLQSAVGGSLR